MERTVGSESANGTLYQYAVTAFLAAKLSSNDEVEDYVIYSDEASAEKFDDIIARVKLKQQTNWYVWLLQVKYSKSSNFKFKKGKPSLSDYIKSFNTIMNNSQLTCRHDILSDNILFGIVCNRSIQTPIPYEFPITKLITVDANITFNPFETNFELFEYQGNSQDKQFFEKCVLWLEKGEESIKKSIQSNCELENVNDLITYIQTYFRDDFLFKQGLTKKVFEIELQNFRFRNFIPPITTLVDVTDDNLANGWNKVTIGHDITIVDDTHDSEIQHYLFKCVFQKINSVLQVHIDQNSYVSENKELDSGIIEKFKTYAQKKRVRYWIELPNTLRTLMIELWKCGDISLIIKTKIPLEKIVKYPHLKRSYIVIDNFEKRSQEIPLPNLKIFYSIASISNNKLRKHMLQNALVSLQGRQETTLQDLLHGDGDLMATFACADIIRIMKNRMMFLQEDSLYKSNFIVFIIANNKREMIQSSEPEEYGRNIVIYCHSSNSEACYKEINTNRKFKRYTICELREVYNKLQFVRGNASKLSTYLVDQYDNPLYPSQEGKSIPVIGQRIYLENYQYLTRSLRRATITKTFFNAQEKRICLLSGDLDDVAAELPFIDIDLDLDKMYFRENKCYFVKVENEKSHSYWNKLHKFGCIYDINIVDDKWELMRYKHYNETRDVLVKDDNIELLQCKNCKNLSLNISYEGEKFPEYKFFRAIRNHPNEIIVITGEAGIGKSSLLKSLFYNCYMRDYVLFYDLINFQVCLNENKNPFVDPLKFIMKEFHKGKWETYYNFVHSLLKKKNLTLILDSFDEIMLTCKHQVLKFIRCIVNIGVPIIIAARVKEFALINQFNAQAVKINPFDAEIDDGYLKNWDFNKDELNNVSSELTSNPLYLNFLRVIASNAEALVNITKTTLYEKVIAMKINRWLQTNYKVIRSSKVNEMMKIFEQMALERMFGKETIEQKLGWKCEDTLSDYIECGIISSFDERGYPVFHHHTFVEFLVAQWIIKARVNEKHKNLAVYLYERLFIENKYEVLRILSDHDQVDLDLHIAIWHVDVYKVETISKGNRWNTVDNLGRTAPHVAIICCSYLNHRFVSYEILEFIIKSMLRDSGDINKYDILGRRWIDYIEPKILEYAGIYNCQRTVETYLRILEANIEQWNSIFPIKKIQNIFSWAITCLSIESISNLLMQNFSMYYISLKSMEEVETRNTTFESEGKLTPLHIACIYGNLVMIQHHIALGADVNQTDRFSCTPLRYSIIRYLSAPSAIVGDVEKIICLLLKNGADIKYVPQELITINGKTATASCERIRKIHDLLKNVQEISFSELHFATPLHDAVLDDNIALVKQLIKTGANITLQNRFGRAPIHLAARGNQLEMIKLLLVGTANINMQDRDGRTALEHAVIEGHVNVVEFLLGKGADMELQNNATNETALHCAARSGYIKILEMLLEKGADLNALDADDSTPLFYAAYSGHAHIIKSLLAHGAKVNVQNVYGSTPLHVASGEKADINAVRLLLMNGAKVNAKDKHSSTPLHFAVDYKHKTIVVLLLDMGADPNAETVGKYTPLLFAAKREDIDVVELLLQKDVNPNSRSTHGWNALELAVRSKNVKLITVLLDYGATVNIEDEGGCTPLHYAAWIGNTDVVKLLLKRNANVNIENKYKITPLAVAVHQKHTDVVRLLLAEKAYFC